MARVLVTEEIAESGLQALRDAGHQVDIHLGLSHEELLEKVPAAAAMIIRSETKVTGEVLAAGPQLQVVGRAGIGLDNVDVGAATRQGVMVVNAPTSNIVSAAEHAIALLLAQARNVPQASAALKEGRWERAKWEGVELYGKTLGVVGLGRIGALVAQRMSGFGMRLVAYDPFISGDKARALGCELLSLDELVGVADFITIHLPKTKETTGLIGKDLLAKVKPGLRIVNAARGGIVDEQALADAIHAGRVQGAGLDVFTTEPTTESPLFELPSVVVTPHLGASTVEAQDKAGVTIAEQVLLALGGEFVPFAVNVDATEPPEGVKPYMALAEALGRMVGTRSASNQASLEVDYRGAIAELDTRVLNLSVLKGYFSANSEVPVSYVNAPQLAEERGLEVQEVKGTVSRRYVSMIVVRSGDKAIAGTLTGSGLESRLVMVDDFDVEVPPAQNMVVIRNDDRPGMVGAVGTALAQAGINIADMALGRSSDGTNALMVISTDQPVSEEVRHGLLGVAGILSFDTLSR